MRWTPHEAAVNRADRERVRMPQATVEAVQQTKRVRRKLFKPLIRRLVGVDGWGCTCIDFHGKGSTPAKAFEAWQRDKAGS